MLTSLYMLSLTVLLTFLVLYAVDKVANRFKNIQKDPAQAEEVPSEIDFSHSYK